MVIGQLTDYASAICADGTECFLAAWAARGGADLPAVLKVEAFGRTASPNRQGYDRPVLAVDRIDSDLRRLVEKQLSRPVDRGVSGDLRSVGLAPV